MKNVVYGPDYVTDTSFIKHGHMFVFTLKQEWILTSINWSIDSIYLKWVAGPDVKGKFNTSVLLAVLLQINDRLNLAWKHCTDFF